MFNESSAVPTRLADLDDAALLDGIVESARQMAAAAARRSDATAELAVRLPWERAVAKVAAAQNISHDAAKIQMHQALASRHRLLRAANPRVAEGTSLDIGSNTSNRDHERG